MRKKDDKGIRGANPACFVLVKSERYCNICGAYIPEDYKDKFGKDDKLVMFHYLGKEKGEQDHLAICVPCFEQIPDGYYGCGCGG